MRFLRCAKETPSAAREVTCNRCREESRVLLVYIGRFAWICVMSLWRWGEAQMQRCQEFVTMGGRKDMMKIFVAGLNVTNEILYGM